MDAEIPKPCPVCGAKAETSTVQDRATLHYVTCSSEYECPDRPITGPQESEAEAIAAWNRGETN